MKVVSVNVGLPREVMWHGRAVTTGIYKQPVAGQVGLRKLDLDGDRQADLSVHGGKDKAVYCYPIEHYDYWRKELPRRELPMGMFGENFTTDGLVEDSVHLGDQFSVGSAEVVSLGSMSRNGTTRLMRLRYGSRCALRRCRRIGRRTSASGWRGCSTDCYL